MPSLTFSMFDIMFTPLSSYCYSPCVLQGDGFLEYYTKKKGFNPRRSINDITTVTFM